MPARAFQLHADAYPCGSHAARRVGQSRSLVMKRPTFATSQDAEQAFYSALQKSDLEAMMAVWAEDEDIYCVHPSGARLNGIDQIRESWRQIFAGGATLRFQLRNQQYLR